MMLRRAIIRAQRADEVCREVRYQFATHGTIADADRLYRLLDRWMKVSLKNRYDRPKVKGEPKC